MAGITMAKLDVKPIAACAGVWKPYKTKADALQKAEEKDAKDQDPRWEEIPKIQDEGSLAYRACFVKEAPSQPFFAAAVKRAEAFLATARGQYGATPWTGRKGLPLPPLLRPWLTPDPRLLIRFPGAPTAAPWRMRGADSAVGAPWPRRRILSGRGRRAAPLPFCRRVGMMRPPHRSA
ncbi:hypothetical protein [Xanthobacter pseudotagetidis]|uniref:hypothetical protein n=1 Tax=Xanthobacter pseudotagetidis TaxID=3119911 RepID=UPI003726FA53